MYAAENGNLEELTLLLRKGADTTIATEARTPSLLLRRAEPPRPR